MGLHLQALHKTPRPYLIALWWRLLGKRVRARLQFAPLLASSPLAYRVWLACEEALEGETALTKPAPAIVALVDTREEVGGAGLGRTLSSLAAEGIAVLGAEASTFETDGEVWFMPLSEGDVLAPGAGAVYRREIAEKGADTGVIYADDDLLDTRGQRRAPHFKPAWNAELFRHFDYLTGACVVRVPRQNPERMREGASGARLVEEAVTRARVEGRSPIRVPHVLHHRRARPMPRIPSPLVQAKADLPLVSVIVPTRNRLDLLRTCLEGLACTNYPQFEVIVVDNGSDDPATLAYLDALDPAHHRVLRCPGPFNFSVLNNRAAAQANGTMLCLLNNDIEVIEPDWLGTMVGQALRPDVGAVGARLLYPNGRIQHAGVILGVGGGGASHAHRLLRPDEEGYFHRHALPQFVSAVTAACLVVRRERFEAVGGLDETHFAVAFNDVDLCMRLNARGWQSFYEPRATLIHHESVSRGLDRDPVGAARLAAELAQLQARWGTADGVDPFHHPQLDPCSERFVVRL